MAAAAALFKMAAFPLPSVPALTQDGGVSSSLWSCPHSKWRRFPFPLVLPSLKMAAAVASVVTERAEAELN